VALVACACSSPATGAGDNHADAEPPYDGGDDADLDAAADSGACELPVSFGTAACDACIASTCCGTVTACGVSPDCKGMLECVRSCATAVDGGGCYAGCKAQFPNAGKTYADVENCWVFTPPCGPKCT